MRYFTQEIQISEGIQRTAGIKARDDIDSILISDGWKAVTVVQKPEKKNKNIIDRTLKHFYSYNEWKNALNHLKKGDELLIQFPIINHSMLAFSVFRNLRRKGVKISLIIHDLEFLRKALSKDATVINKIRLNFEEKSILRLSDKIIAHNMRMKKFLVSMGFDAGKIIVLRIFDYLIPEEIRKESGKKCGLDKPVIIAGNLRTNKAGYVYDLPDNCRFNLYGVGYEAPEKDNVKYFGSFPPDDLPAVLEGSFGLIWDGDTAQTCSGTYGDYLKINNPHKTSLYLASSIPVVIWSKAALADFVRKNNCGITVDSISDIPEVISGLSEEQYQKMKRNAEKISCMLCSGRFTLEAVGKI